MRNFKIVSLVLFVSLLSFSAFGQKTTIYSSGNGGWMSTTSWAGGVVPTSSDFVVIQVGHTVTLDAGFPPMIPTETGAAAGVYVYGTLTVGGVLTSTYGIIVSGVGGTLTWLNASSSCTSGGIEIQNGSTNSTFSQDIDCNNSFTIKSGGEATIGGNVSCSASVVDVEGDLKISGNFTVDNDLKISADGVVTVASSKTLSVGGDLDINNAKTDKIVLNGSLSVTGSTTCEIAFPADRFTSFCPPMSNSTANQMIDPGGDNVWVTYWTPGANSSTAYNYITSLSTALTNQGYMFWPDNNAGLTVDFSGNLRVASGTSFSYSASWGAGGTEDGYNFIGNPFPCHIDINDFTFSSIYSSTVYIWNGSSFTARNTSSTIKNVAPFQGFFVQATGNSASVAFNQSAAMASTSSFLKSDTEKSDFRRLHIEIEGNGYAQEFYLFVSENATMGHDDTYDVHSFFGLDVVPYLYTVPEYDLEPHCFYGVPELSDGDDDYQIPLTVQTGAATEYGFFFTGMEDFSSDYRLFLYDILLDKKINLYEQNTYVCDLETGVTSDRFILILEKDLVSVEEIDDEKFGTVFVQDSDLIISLEDNRNGKISVFDMMGKCVAEQNVSGSQTIISMGNKKGCFVVNVVMKDGGITEKVVIK